ncbi:ABC transporter permease subunit [Mycoplasma sp. NEAQ87857]|uniref:ABC transporter permease n=1 Tax=Mycoplasma sp. NEAQ87857 TaxID=2683967 RepID=UPI0013175E6B|nr:ABC transporter permease [Mycoplasma sp. NEAQ87857]QGZ97651.1 ABC transporter permease subunit [Mycoplasma sp. NEAQ87857]
MISKINAKLQFNGKLALLIPYVLVAIFLIILPIILIIHSAFSQVGDFDSFILIKTQTTWNIILRSIWVGLASAVICLIIAFPYAYFLSTSKSKIFQIYALSLIISPMAIFTIARIYSIKGLALSIFSTDPSALNSHIFMIIGLTYLNLPLMVMPLYSVFKDMPKNIIEASNDLGYNNFKTLFKVILPYGTKAILSGLAMIFLASATTFIISDKLLPDGSNFKLIGNVLNPKINPGNKYDLSSASVLVIVVSAIFIGIYSLFLIIPRIIFKFKKGAHYE